MDKNQLLAIEQNLIERQQEIAQMQQDINVHKEQLDSHTAQELSMRLGTLYKEYTALKQQVLVLHANEVVYEQVRNANMTANPSTAVDQTTIHPATQSIPQPAQNAQNTPRPRGQVKQSPAQQRKPVQPKPKKDWEKTLGKSVMGVMASILVFVALIMFAIVALPSMTDTIKMIAMFVISGGITGIGMLLMRKDQKNAFNASIAGCGIGAVFISLMTTRMYFNAINDYVLYITLLIWAAAVAFFSKDKNKVFVVIAEVGISVATFIGLAGLLGADSAASLKANMLIAFALLSEVAIYYFNSTDDMTDDIYMHLPHAIRTFIMSIMFVILADFGDISGIPIMMAVFIGIGLYLLGRSDGTKGKSFILTTYILPIMLVYNNYAVTICGTADHVVPYVVFIGMAIIYHAFAFIYNEFKTPVVGSHIVLVVCAIYFMSEVSAHEVLDVMTILLPAALMLMPITLMAKHTGESYWKWVSAALPLFCALLWWDIGGLSNTKILIGFVIALIYVFANFVILDDSKDDGLRTTLYVASLLIFPMQFGDIIYCWDVNSVATEAFLETIYVACGYLPAVIAYLWVDKTDCITREKDISVLQNVIMSVLILVGAINLHDTSPSWMYEAASAAQASKTAATIASWIFGLTLIGLNVARTFSMLNKGRGYGIGVSAAYAVSLWAIITRISDVNYIVSITMLLLAIGMIIMGFKINLDETTGNKEMRLFGLVLSMVVTVKLLMLDIEHNNLLETSGYLLLAGVLCFAISFAYNRLDRVMVREQIAMDDEELTIEEPKEVDTLENS